MNSPDPDASAGGKILACPICKSAAAPQYAPFCSKRCADVDLHRWLTGGYAIAAGEDDSDGVSDRPEDGESV